MTKKEIAKFVELDEAAEKAGGYVDPNADVPDYDIRAVDDYCKKRGIDPSTLTDEELKPFIRRKQQAA